MNRLLAFVGALLLAFISISSACTAAPTEWVHFTLSPQRGSESVQASFSSDGRTKHHQWSAGFRPSDLVGLDLAGFRRAGSRPIGFALIREAGRLDCTGAGGSSSASGSCRFSVDSRFEDLLASHGIGRPTADQAFGLMAVNARRELIDALASARYPVPSIDELTALFALGTNGAYISELARAGYRPRTVDALVQFKALDITPGWIAGFARIGYADLPADELVQLKAMEITPDYIEGFDRIGYRHLAVRTLVQLKALDITPEFVRTVAGGASMPPVDQLVMLKIFGRR
jgi:hypothetical protein